MELKQFIDHSLLKSTASPEDIRTLVKEAVDHQFYAVCVNSCYTLLAADLLKNERVKVVTTIGFPLGTASSSSKIAEAKKAIEEGSDELDMVINLGHLKSGLVKSIREEISSIKKIAGSKILKVIIETCYLSDDEKRLACEIVVKAGGDFVKTSTGFGSAGATLHDVNLLSASLPHNVGIKASGGIHSGRMALELIAAGASRIGTSNGIHLVHSL